MSRRPPSARLPLSQSGGGPPEGGTGVSPPYCGYPTHGDMETWRHGDMEIWRHGDMETWRYGDMEIWRHGDMEIWRHGDIVCVGTCTL